LKFVLFNKNKLNKGIAMKPTREIARPCTEDVFDQWSFREENNSQKIKRIVFILNLRDVFFRRENIRYTFSLSAKKFYLARDFHINHKVRSFFQKVRGNDFVVFSIEEIKKEEGHTKIFLGLGSLDQNDFFDSLFSVKERWFSSLETALINV
jgi:hypothetical protein